MHEKQRDFEANLLENTAKRLPFNAKINQMSHDQAMTKQAMKARFNQEGAGETMEFVIDAIDMSEQQSNAVGAFDQMDDMGDDIEAKMRVEAL